ncbi:CPG4 domain-containing protein [Meloidogyne graminicola]|uniref:CPG4 domain-containing protein n=1 Tax=Meloidogyne graminicola TaxID=189291 RepID=A0A8S9ZIG2_9BILA|nr:CPG4 domain-containing protein [Meloidogyne graminicola]
MLIKFILLITIFKEFIFVLSQEKSSLSPCLQRCMESMKIENSISNMYRNYEKVCENLEKSANCAQKCSLQDQSQFFQFTTFYRIHCIDFEEELEQALPCLKEAAYKSDISLYFIN